LYQNINTSLQFNQIVSLSRIVCGWGFLWEIFPKFPHFSPKRHNEKAPAGKQGHNALPTAQTDNVALHLLYKKTPEKFGQRQKKGSRTSQSRNPNKSNNQIIDYD